jgi:hypothetical protein
MRVGWRKSEFGRYLTQRQTGKKVPRPDRNAESLAAAATGKFTFENTMLDGRILSLIFAISEQFFMDICEFSEIRIRTFFD